MFRWERLLLIVCIMTIGILVYDNYISDFGKQVPYSVSGEELASPSDWIKEQDIERYEDKVIINIANASLAKFADTNSMDPLIDEDSNSIEIKAEPSVGDIISYSADARTVIHRVIDISEDEKGLYYLVKGDNNNFADEKVRPEQITGVVVGIIY